MADDISRENSISCSFTRRFFLFLFFFLFYLMIIIILFFVVVVAVFNPWNSCVFRVSLPSVRIDPCVLSTRFSGWKRIFFWASIVFAVGLVPSTPPPPLRIGQDRPGSFRIGQNRSEWVRIVQDRSGLFWIVLDRERLRLAGHSKVH